MFFKLQVSTHQWIMKSIPIIFLMKSNEILKIRIYCLGKASFHNHLASDMQIYIYYVIKSSLVAQRLKRLPPMWQTQVRSLGREDPLEKEMVTHSSILAWRIPWTEELGGLQSTGHKESDTTERLRSLTYQATCSMPSFPSLNPLFLRQCLAYV